MGATLLVKIKQFNGETSSLSRKLRGGFDLKSVKKGLLLIPIHLLCVLYLISLIWRLSSVKLMIFSNSSKQILWYIAYPFLLLFLPLDSKYNINFQLCLYINGGSVYSTFRELSTLWKYGTLVTSYVSILEHSFLML